MRRPKRRLMAAPPMRTGYFSPRRPNSLTINGICFDVLTNRALRPIAVASTSGNASESREISAPRGVHYVQVRGTVGNATEQIAVERSGRLSESGDSASYREFAQAPDIHRRQFKAKPWAEEIMQLALANVPEREIHSRIEVEPKTMNLNADPELLAQALLNLLRNSIRATADLSQPVVVLALAREPGGQFRIEVRDNGPGIPEDRREDIFLPFYTTHKGGSGVGLSFARQVALAHGGSICALPAPEGGANLRIVV